MSYPLHKVRHFCLILLFCAQSFILSALAAQTAMAQALHPLDPLTAEEIRRRPEFSTPPHSFHRARSFRPSF